MSSEEEYSSRRSLGASCGIKRGRNIYEDDDDDPSQQYSNALSQQGSPEKLSSTSSDASNKRQPQQLKTDQIFTQDSTSELESALLPWQAGSSNSYPPLSEGTQPHRPPPPASVDLLPFDEAFQLPHHEQNTNLIHQNHRGVPPQRVTDFKDLIQYRQSLRLLGHHSNKPAMQNMGNSSEVTSNYGLPTSNLPPELSTLQVPVSHLSYTQFAMPLGSGTEVSSLVKTKLANWHPQNQINMHEHSNSLGPKESQIQGCLNQAALPSTLKSSGLPSLLSHQGMGSRSPWRPLHMESGFLSSHSSGLQGSSVPLTGKYQVLKSSSRHRKTRGIWQNEIPSISNSTQRMNSQAPTSRYLGNSLYDPRYEAMGLPVDPHLRIFLMKNDDRAGNDGDPNDLSKLM